MNDKAKHDLEILVKIRKERGNLNGIGGKHMSFL